VLLNWRRLAALLTAIVGLLLAPSAMAEQVELRAIVFVSSPSQELDASLRDALTAQLSGSSAVLVFEHFSVDGAPLRRQVSEARSLAAAHDAAGVYWLDAQSEKDWLLYLAERSGDRVLVRRLEIETGGTAAAVEAVSVITRQSTDALLAGQTIGMQPVDVPAEGGASSEPSPQPAVPPASGAEEPKPRTPTVAGPPRRAIAIGIGYYGDSFASQIPWQSGMRFGASYRSSFGLYAGAGYVFFRESTVQAPHVAFQITRTPIDLGVGLELARGRLVPSVGLRGIVDVVHRQGISAEPPAVATPDTTLPVVFLSPRLQVGYTVSEALGVYLGGGVDFAINAFSFISRVDGRDDVLLSLRGVRLSAEAGLTFWP
jgi:hypothetical protein